MAHIHRQDETPSIPLGVPVDLSGNAGMLDEIQRYASRRSQRSLSSQHDGLERRDTLSGMSEKDRDVEQAPGEDEEVHEDDCAC